MLGLGVGKGILALVTAAVVGVGAISIAVFHPAGIGDTSGDDSDSYIVRALGDSVTAGFGFLPDGEEMSSFQLPHCAPPSPPDGRCQSPDQIAYPAVFAKHRGLARRRPTYANLAISGSTPSEWLEGRLRQQLDGVVRNDPDLTVLTLGANPLLDKFLVPTHLSYFCAHFASHARRCIEDQLRKFDVVAKLAGVYEALLRTDPEGRRGKVVVFQYPRTVPLSISLARVQLLFDELRGTIEQAVARARSEVPDQAERLVLVDPGPFLDHPCRSAYSWILSADTCIHPNAEGHRQIAAQLERVASGEPALQPSAVTREALASAGDQCGLVKTDRTFHPRRGMTKRIWFEVKVERGVAPCSRARGLLRWYVEAPNPCVDAGNTCVLYREGWVCSAPTAGSYPIVYACSHSGGRFEIAGTDYFRPKGRFTRTGLGPVRIGMSPAEVVARFGPPHDLRTCCILGIGERANALDYVYYTGYTGRPGRSGVTLSFCRPTHALSRIETDLPQFTDDRGIGPGTQFSVFASAFGDEPLPNSIDYGANPFILRAPPNHAASCPGAYVPSDINALRYFPSADGAEIERIAVGYMYPGGD